MIDGKKEIKMHGEMVKIRAKVEKLSNMSDHADANEIMDWLKTMPKKPKKVFITHGEVEASEALSKRIEKELGWKTEVPDYLEMEKIK